MAKIKIKNGMNNEYFRKIYSYKIASNEIDISLLPSTS